MVNIVELRKIDTRGGNGVRQTLNFGMPDARKPKFQNVSCGSQPEVSQGRGNVRFRGYSGSRFRATGCLLVANNGSPGVIPKSNHRLRQ